MTSTGILRDVGYQLNNSVGDAAPGSSISVANGAAQSYAGQLGAWMLLSWAEAQRRSAPTATVTQSLQGGRYQYVQFAADGTAYAVGQLLYWKDETNYIVTNVAPTATSANFAGFCISAVTQGNYWFVQTGGVAWVQYAASVTGTVASQGVYAVINTNTADSYAPATADATAGVNKLFLGVSKDAASNSGIGRVYITSVVEVQ